MHCGLLIGPYKLLSHTSHNYDQEGAIHRHDSSLSALLFYENDKSTVQHRWPGRTYCNITFFLMSYLAGLGRQIVYFFHGKWRYRVFFSLMIDTMTFDTAAKQLLALRCFSRAGGKILRMRDASRVPEQSPCDSGSEQAGGNWEQPCMQTARGHARTITHVFMHALMHLCKRESKHTSHSDWCVLLHARSRSSILRKYGHALAWAPPLKSRWCAQMSCVACDSINEWTALSSGCVRLDIRVSWVRNFIPFDPLMWISQHHGWLCVCVCLCVWDGAQYRGAEIESLSFSCRLVRMETRCLIHHSATNEPEWGNRWRQVW